MEVYFDDIEVTVTETPVIQTDDYYPFGLTFNSYQRSTVKENKMNTFQDQEIIKDLDLNWISFKWRNHDPSIGRFFNVDPIAEDYYYNSPYAFSENKVVSHIELEGLEAKLAIAGLGGMSGRDDNTFKARANRYAGKIGGVSVQASSGKEFVQQLQTATQNEGSIESVTVFSHGGPDAIYMEYNNSFYAESNDFKGPNAADIQNLTDAINDGSVKFEEGAVVVLGGCSCGMTLGPQLTEETGVTTISSTSNVSPEIVDGKETGRLVSDGNFIKTEYIKNITNVPVPQKINADGSGGGTPRCL